MIIKNGGKWRESMLEGIGYRDDPGFARFTDNPKTTTTTDGQSPMKHERTELVTTETPQDVRAGGFPPALLLQERLQWDRGPIHGLLKRFIPPHWEFTSNDTIDHLYELRVRYATLLEFNE
jgi:hypothetical protein